MHLRGYGEAGYPVAVDIPERMLPAPERDGAEPAGPGGHTGPAEHFLLDGRQVAVHCLFLSRSVVLSDLVTNHERHDSRFAQLPTTLLWPPQS